MPSITKDQREICKLAQLSQALQVLRFRKHSTTVSDLVQQIDDVNLKILNNKSSTGPLIGGTPLHIAAVHNDVEAFNSLLGHGADFTIQNKFGHTALHKVFYDAIRKSDTTLKEINGLINNELIDSVLKAHVESGVTKNPQCANGLSHFHIACAANHLAAVQLFLGAGVFLDESVSHSNKSRFAGYTPLHFATRYRGYAIVKLLLERGADVRAKQAKGLTPLHLAIRQNVILMQLTNGASSKDVQQLIVCLEESQKITSLLLEDNRVVDIDSMGFRKSHAACTLADTLLAERFLREVDVNCAINMDSTLFPGYTPLHFAVRCNIEIAKLLLRKGANIEAEDDQGVTPLYLCLKKFESVNLHHILPIVPGSEDIFFSDNKTKLSDFLYSMRSRSTLSSFFQTTPSDIALPRNSPLWPGQGLSHLLVRCLNILGYDKTALLLSVNGYTVIQQDALGRTPIHVAFYENNMETVDLLLKNQSKITDAVDHNGLSHLLIACDRENVAIVQILLSQGVKANVNVVFKDKTLSSIVNNCSTPLHVAVSRRNIEIIRLLVKFGADANVIDADGVTPIHCLIAQPHHEYEQLQTVKQIGELLLSSCDLKNIVSKTGLSHLHIACYADNENAVESLLKLGADTNAVTTCIYPHSKKSCRQTELCFTGYTPSHFTLKNRNTKLTELLLQSGCDILYKKPDGMTLLCDVMVGFTFKSTHIDVNCKKTFMSILANSPALQKRAEDEFGLSLLHLACFIPEVEQIQSLLADSRVDVNAQLHGTLFMSHKDTPLHLLIKWMDLTEKNMVGIVELLLKSGSDVTIMNNNGNTPAHIAWFYGFYRRNRNYIFILRLLLRHHRDFSVNPVNIRGISHFHLACLVGEYHIAEQFLKAGVDVNLSIDFHHTKYPTYQTPLLFMMRTPIDVKAHLRTIDVLIKYGADINAQDKNGSTALLRVAKLISPRELYLKKLCEAGADTKSINLKGQSVLETMLDSSNSITNEELKFFFEYSHLFNTYNSIYGMGITSWMLRRARYAEDRFFLLDTMLEVPSLFSVDPRGRTPIHNLIANDTNYTPPEVYTNYIERFVNMGYDIDAQDSIGRTALHLAALFNNEKALSGLLSAGADINLIDNNKETPLEMHIFVFTTNPDSPRRNLIERARNVIVLHIIAMLLCGLEVNSHDFKFIEPKVSEEQFNSHRKQVSREFEMSKLTTIGMGSLTLKDFLSETGAVASRPSMASETDRQAADKLLECIDIESFPKIKGLIKLQNKKMLTRLSTMQAATDSLRRLIGSVDGFSMPEICCRMILRLLSNTQVKHVIESVSVDETK